MEHVSGVGALGVGTVFAPKRREERETRLGHPGRRPPRNFLGVGWPEGIFGGVMPPSPRKGGTASTDSRLAPPSDQFPAQHKFL